LRHLADVVHTTPITPPLRKYRAVWSPPRGSTIDLARSKDVHSSRLGKGEQIEVPRCGRSRLVLSCLPPLLQVPFILQHVCFIKGLLLYQTCHKCGTLVETSLAQNAKTRKRGGAASCGKKRTKLFFLKTPLELNATRRLIFDNLRPTK
jgi:hypothetical protein